MQGAKAYKARHGSRTCGGLIQESDAGLGDELGSDADAPLLAARQAPHEGVPNQAVSNLQAPRSADMAMSWVHGYSYSSAASSLQQAVPPGIAGGHDT